MKKEETHQSFITDKKITSDCVTPRDITRIINSISIIYPNSQNGCQWDCGLSLSQVIRQEHIKIVGKVMIIENLLIQTKLFFYNWLKPLILLDSWRLLKSKNSKKKEFFISIEASHYTYKIESSEDIGWMKNFNWSISCIVWTYFNLQIWSNNVFCKKSRPTELSE